MYALLLYGVPVVVVAVTLYAGFLGVRFYLREVVRDATAGAPSDAAPGDAPSAGREG